MYEVSMFFFFSFFYRRLNIYIFFLNKKMNFQISSSDIYMNLCKNNNGGRNHYV